LSQNRYDKDKADDSATGLYLERTPDTGSQREIDEVVPEFMHRAFYRSTEDEYQTVDSDLTSRLSRKSEERAKMVESSPPPATPPPKPLRSPEPSVEREPLEPLRQLDSADSDPEVSREDTVAVPLRTKTQPPQSPPPTQPATSAARQPGVNFSIIAALLFVVGLFIWREQTRPNIPPEQPLPIPQNSQVVQQENPEPPALGEESPYPEMSPRVAAPAEREQPVEALAEDTPEDLERAATLAEEEPVDTTTYPSREASAQRAAIMQNMSDRTVTNMEKASREAPAAAPDDSLFPVDRPTSQPVVSTTQKPQMDADEAAATEAAISGSLFPTDIKTSPESQPNVTQPGATQTNPTQPVAASKPPAAKPPRPPVRPPVQGEPYEIAEPTF
jgi:hypothetical protein